VEALEVLRTSPFWLAVGVAIMGLCVGSFLNVVIYRLPKMMEAQWRADCAELDGGEAPRAEVFNLVTPRSRCPSCGAPITVLQNVPVASWIVLRGKCASCRAPISARYPAIELLAAAIGVGVSLRFGWSPALAFGLVFAWALIALTFIDLDTQLLPDDITLPLLWIGLIANAFGTYVDLRSAVFGAVGGYLLLWGVYWGFRLVAGKEGMGFGDFKLLAAIGAWTGWQVLPVAILVSAGLGAVIGSAALWLSKKGFGTRIPFGPYLALGGFVSLLWGAQIVQWWLGRAPS
jgi:leader peptidase (prepilin peptidase)/N-methyltransferase